ncbi:MAG: DUF4405 domain-containing protein [archaeon]
MKFGLRIIDSGVRYVYKIKSCWFIKMVSLKTNLILDVLLFIDFLVCVLSGIFMKMRLFVFDFSGIHVLSGVLLIILVLFHFGFHFSSIRYNFFRSDVDED